MEKNLLRQLNAPKNQHKFYLFHQKGFGNQRLALMSIRKRACKVGAKLRCPLFRIRTKAFTWALKRTFFLGSLLYPLSKFSKLIKCWQTEASQLCPQLEIHRPHFDDLRISIVISEIGQSKRHFV